MVYIVLVGDIVISFNGIRIHVGLVIFDVFVPHFDFPECQEIVELLMKLVQVMHIQHIKVKDG